MTDYPISEIEAQTLRNPAYITQMRQQAKTVERSLDVPGKPETLWPLISATDFLNQQAGMQTTASFFLARESGSPWMHAQTKNAGLTVAYEELPYEWLAPTHYQVERLHSKGPLKYLCFGVDLKPENAYITLITCRIRFVSHLPGPVARVLVQKEVNKFMSLFHALAMKQQGGVLLKAFYAPETAKLAAIQALAQKWEAFEPNPAICQALADYILRAPERLAYRIRPHELAEAYELDPLAILKACLRLTRQQQLHLMWDCRCPGCKGPKESFRHLSELQAVAYCESCAVNYGVAFDQNLELSFQPSSQIRAVSENYFCAGSPANTPHISWQANILPGLHLTAVLDLAPGYYVLRTLLCANEITVRIDPSGKSEMEVEIQEQMLLNQNPVLDSICIQSGSLLKLRNQRTINCTLMLESLAWQSQSVTAAQVQSVQAFHDLFPDEILAANESLPLHSQVFLLAYTDTRSEASPELHDLCHRFIQQHEGAAVVLSAERTLGIFASAYEALAAAWDLRQELSGLNLMYENPERLVLALSQGPCEVYRDGQRLNYRGPAIEALEAALANCQDGIIAHESFYQNPGLASFFEDPQAEWLRLPNPSGEDYLQIREQALELEW